MYMCINLCVTIELGVAGLEGGVVWGGGGSKCLFQDTQTHPRRRLPPVSRQKGLVCGCRVTMEKEAKKCFKEGAQ